MSRLDALNTSGLPLPVKFRQVLHDSSLLDHKVDKLEEESDADSVLSDTESSLPTEFHRKFFFKVNLSSFDILICILIIT